MTSQMLVETREAPERVEAMLGRDEAAYGALAGRLADRPPSFAATVARGSSDHAATYLAALLGIGGGLATASIAPSLVTRYGARLHLKDALVVGLSQSGAGPDVLATIEAARAGGAVTVAIVNAEGSPVGAAAEYLLPQRAGPERSVAATKSFILTLAVAARLVARWRGDPGLAAALERLPAHLDKALACDWSAALPMLQSARSLYVVGRGPALGIAQETALKLKETSGLHAEALSAAEVQHGPRAVIGEGFPVLAYGLADPGGEDARAFARDALAAGASVAVAAPGDGAGGLHLPLPEPLHPLLDPIVAAQAFYVFAESLARARGHDPDRPQGLRKVTRTL
ncbi:MAG TPA: SIS domain-containing protein [Geminicoccaceae bacterium]|nr:SIS domain-containing protein [Geminicoccus sp.]HMU49193.1 SIS domain-containing protein [Geminicoccaceae bacterium]